MSEISAFLFDLGGVLVTVDSSDSIQNLARDLQVDERTVRSGMTHDLMLAYEKGFIDSDEFYQRLLKNCGAEGRLDIDTFRSYWQDVLFPNELMITFMRQVSSTFPVWFLSNTNDYHYQQMMDKFSFMHLARGGIYSFQVGAVKPEPEIYQHVFRITGLEPGELIFIDDLPANVVGARKEGIPSIQFDSHGDLCRQLAADYPDIWEQVCA